MTTKKRNWKRRAAFLLGPLLLLLGLYVLQRVAPKVLAFFEAPLVSAGTFVTQTWGDAFQSTGSLRAENDRLAAEAAALAIDKVSFETLRTENENLKQQLSFLERQSYRHVTARIISRSVGEVSQTFVIDRGTEDGLAEGAPVIVADGQLVGKVIHASAQTAVVRATTDRESRVGVSVLNGSRTIGIAEGTTGALLAVRFIPQDETVSVNDLIVTSGLEPGVPPGLVVGIVNTVSENRTAPFQEAAIEPLADVRQTNIVSVLLLDVSL